MKRRNIPCRRLWFAAVVLFVLILLVYSNTFQASWQMDDFPNITNNRRLHIFELTYDNIIQSLFAHPQAHRFKELYRPVASLSFGLNWLFGKDDVAGYHFVNIAVHFFAAFVLYLTIAALFGTPRLERVRRGQVHEVALLAAALWAVHPLQTQAVTYVVQRMASLAALFYLLGIFCYIKARLNAVPQRRGLLYAACIVSYLLALGSKENAAVLPLALILVEITFFHNAESTAISRRLFWSAAGGALFVLLTGTLFFLKGDFFSFIQGYGIRPFSLGERLLTEPRVLIFYLSQLVLPLPGRFSIAHDVTVSSSLFNPAATLPAIILVLGLIGFSIWRLKQWPLVSFGFLFFFLNHIIESTIIPLELAFEHRNYLPTMFLFWPLAMGVERMIGLLETRRKPMLKTLFCTAVILIVCGLGVGTYRRNTVWATEKTLWEDVLKKAPGLARPYLVLANDYDKQNDFEQAMAYYKKSLTLPDQRPLQARGTAYNNMGTMHLKRNDITTAIALYQQALAIRPHHSEYRHNLAIALVRARRWQPASDQIDRLVSRYSNNPKYLNLKGYILLNRGQPGKAVDYLRKALQLAPYDRNVIANYGIALSLSGKNGQAERVLKRLGQIYAADMTILMGLIENSLRAGDRAGFEHYANRLLATFSIGDIRNFLLDLAKQKVDVPLTVEILAPAIGDLLKQKSSNAG